MDAPGSCVPAPCCRVTAGTGAGGAAVPGVGDTGQHALLREAPHEPWGWGHRFESPPMGPFEVRHRTPRFAKSTACFLWRRLLTLEVTLLTDTEGPGVPRLGAGDGKKTTQAPVLGLKKGLFN